MIVVGCYQNHFLPKRLISNLFFITTRPCIKRNDLGLDLFSFSKYGESK